ALAIGAAGIAAVVAEKDARLHAIALCFEVFKESSDAGEPVVALQEPPLMLGRERPVGHIERDAVALREGAQLRFIFAGDRLVPRLDGGLLEGPLGFGDDPVQIEAHDVAEALARGASAEGIVKGKQAGLRRLVNNATGPALERLAES